MQYREVGSTGVRVSEIAFGCADPSGLMTSGAFEDQLRVCSRAIELGINYFDTAPDYGTGASEVSLGKVLKELGVRPFIVTKIEVRQENLDDIAGHVQRSLDASLERLQVDYVDLLQIHNGPTIERPQIEGASYRVLGIEDYFAPNGAIEGITRAQRQGKTRLLGFIVRGNDKEPVRRLIDTGIFNMINVPYTLLNPTANLPLPAGMEVDGDFGEVIPYAEAHGVGTAIYSPLGGGLLADGVVQRGEFHPSARPLLDRQRPLLARAKALGFLSTKEHSLAQAAYRFILSATGVTAVLGGFADIGQMEELVAVSGAGPLSPELMARVEMVWRAKH